MLYLTRWLKKILIIIGLFVSVPTKAQRLAKLTIEQANSLARENYPLIKKKKLLLQTAQLNMDNFSKGFLPQFSVEGQATYQSVVTQIDIPMSGFDIPSPGKSQYKILLDVSQLIYDGGAIKLQKELQHLQSETNLQKIEVELYQLRMRINQLYFGVLYLTAQEKQANLLVSDIQIGIKKVAAQVKNGVALQSGLNILKAALLKAGQRKIELEATKKGMLHMLELFTGANFASDVFLKKPLGSFVKLAPIINRQELLLFDKKEAMLSLQSKMVNAKKQPKMQFFFRGGYGRPTLNFLANKFDFYYLGGIRFNWLLNGLYTSKNNHELLEIKKRNVDVDKETFLLNTRAQLKGQEATIDKLKLLIKSDEEIIILRESVKQTAQVQLKNGVIMVDDYMRAINAEDQARQAFSTHNLQLLQAIIEYKTISGKL